MPVISIDPSKKALIDAQRAVAAADEWFAAQIASGFTSEDGITLGLSTEDVTLLTGNFVLAKEASSLGAPIPPVIDKAGVPHSLDIEQLTALMLEYGQHRAAISAEYAQRKATAANE